MQYVSVQYTRYYKLDASYVKSDLLVIHHLFSDSFIYHVHDFLILTNWRQTNHHWWDKPICMIR